VCGGDVVSGEVVVDDGRIVEVVAGGGSAEAVDLGDDWLVPGFIDVHVHGGGGGQFNTSSVDEVAAVARFHAEHGTTALLATTVTAPPDELFSALRAIARARMVGGGATVLGAHLEGPFLSRERPGAMDPELFLAPDVELFRRLVAAGDGSVKMMTLAPELPGAHSLIEAVVRAGAIASLGHSDATYAEAAAGIDAGARSATHLFNAMRPFHHREPGILGAVLGRDEVNCELICDGIHVDPVALRVVLAAKGQAGVRLVTDAMQASGMPEGEYRLGGAAVDVRDGRAEIAGGGSIAGSTLTMGGAVRNAVRFLRVDVVDAVTMGSLNPARVLGIEDRKGSIAAGMDADLVVLDDSLSVRATMVGGSWVLEPASVS
jgi:N-acetylglucosamine-6-phosphate deacetylase